MDAANPLFAFDRKPASVPAPLHLELWQYDPQRWLLSILSDRAEVQHAEIEVGDEDAGQILLIMRDGTHRSIAIVEGRVSWIEYDEGEDERIEDLRAEVEEAQGQAKAAREEAIDSAVAVYERFWADKEKWPDPSDFEDLVTAGLPL